MAAVGTKNKYNLISFGSPIIVEIENVGNVTLNQIIMPKYKDQIDDVKLMGVDFMKKYTFVFGLFNNKYSAKVFPAINNIL